MLIVGHGFLILLLLLVGRSVVGGTCYSMLEEVVMVHLTDRLVRMEHKHADAIGPGK